ncbi:MAG TPA: D-alanyl-D-alanine dipeptidase [Rhodothermales bacterium]|nr:D-alanyl-D-alanine dipeptidase [Rhodothermales bacterium]
MLRLLPFLWLAGCLGTAEPETADVPPPALADTASARLAEAPAEPDTTERPPLPDQFVRLSEYAPGIAQEMRYTTAYNFVGEPIDGYLAPECILTERAAEALAAVAADLAPEGLGLKVYDCYRPQQAVDHFARWARGSDASMKTAFYPDEARGALFRRGYIASRSGHSRGSTVDLTLVRLPAADAVLTSFPSPDRLARCDAPRGERLDERDLDMGTAYDCLDPQSATARASGAVARNRQRLKSAMEAHGFRNYSKEWWHFTFWHEPFPGTYRDFPVQ